MSIQPTMYSQERCIEEIEAAWDRRDKLTEEDKERLRGVVDHVLELLDSGSHRVAQPVGSGKWYVNEWLKKAVLLSFRLHDNIRIGDDHDVHWFDKVDQKTAGWNDDQFRQAGFRAVPGSFARHASYIAPDVVLMPSFVNIGAFVDEGTMVDTWATIGSCAQIGKRCHISGGVGIGGVLEPIQAAPVIIEDDVFVGARSEVVEGVIVRQGAVVSMGCFIGQSTSILDETTGDWLPRGEIPGNAVVVPGNRMHRDNRGIITHSTYCVVIKKYANVETRNKVGLNELLRD